jgi:hypothetical protein
MESTNHNDVTDAFLDEAAGHAIGAHTPEDAAAFQTVLTSAMQADRQAVAGLRDVAARMAAASPYMEPPPNLRAAILAATAPANYKIKDYRRTADDRSNRYLRWGMAAAVVCLMWSGYYTMGIKQQSAKMVGVIQDQGQKLTELAQRLDSDHSALNALVDPAFHQIYLRSGPDKKIIGKMLVDSRTNEVMVVMPDAAIPPNAKMKLTLQQNGAKTEITAVAIGGAPGSGLMRYRLPQAVDPSQPLDVQINDGPKIAGFK